MGAGAIFAIEGPSDASGLFAAVKRDLDGLSIIFYEGAGGQSRTLTLQASSAAAWTGELVADGVRLEGGDDMTRLAERRQGSA